MSSSKAWFDFAELGFQALFHRTLQCLQLTNWFPVCPLFVSPLHPTARVWHPLATSSSEAKSSLFCCWILSNMLWSDSEEKTFLFSTSGIRKMFAAKNSLEKKFLQLIEPCCLFSKSRNDQMNKSSQNFSPIQHPRCHAIIPCSARWKLGQGCAIKWLKAWSRSRMSWNDSPTGEFSIQSGEIILNSKWNLHFQDSKLIFS